MEDMAETTRDVSFDDIPQAVLEDVRQEIGHYFVALLRISPEDRDKPVALGGSGTLVELAGRHYVLTADHVWKGTDGWNQVGLAIADEGMPLAIPRDAITPKRLRGTSYSEWGPDLAMFEIPVPLVGTIKARKSFLNLARRQAMLSEHPPKTKKTVWAVMGLVLQSSSVGLVPEKETALANIRAEAFFGVTCDEQVRDGYDYLTLSAKTTLPGVPSSFAGVSGGGLWQIGLTMKAGAVVSRGEHHFRGVAFWEQPQGDNILAIRCHGPRSIFDRAWTEWSVSS